MSNAFKPCVCFCLPPLQMFIFSPCPSRQCEIHMVQDRVKFRPAKFPKIVDPTGNHWIYKVSQRIQTQMRACIKLPISLYCLPQFLCGFLTYRGTEADKELSALIPSRSRTKGISQKIETIAVPILCSIRVLTVDNSCLFRI